MNTLNAGPNFSLLNTDKLTQPIQMRLSKNQTALSQCFSGFLKCRLNFEIFQKKGDPSG